jgi:proteasome alpha subunit
MQFYTSPEQIMRDRSEYARKGISRGRSAIVLSYVDGVLFVAENLTSLRKTSEIYDRIGFAAVGRYNEFENLRSGGVRMADLRGYSYDRRDVTARWLANAYAQTLGAIFTEQTKPFEVEICIAQVGTTPAGDELYRITYDGSVGDEHGYVAMGGQAEAISNVLRREHNIDLALGPALSLAVKALGSVGGEGGAPRQISADQLEVAVLERRRPGRAFRRILGNALTRLLGNGAPAAEEIPGDAPPPTTPPAKLTPTSTAEPPTPPAEPSAPPVEQPTPPAEPPAAT